MAVRLDFVVRFLVDRYHGNEWPPTPARLFQALVAGARTGAAAKEWSGGHDQALQWLEQLDPPEVLARSTKPGKAYTLFVPNNSLDKERKSTKTSKAVRPYALSHHQIGDIDVVYRWHVDDSTENRRHLGPLDEIASRLRALGWGVDFAMACVEFGEHNMDERALERYIPDPAGDNLLRLPQPGFLQHLSDCHAAFRKRITTQGVNPFTRPTRFREERYRNAAALQARRSILFELEQLSGEPFAARWDQAQTISAMMRHAANEAARNEFSDPAWIDSYVCGHNDAADLGHRLSYVPLPSIGHPHSDGAIRRVAIVEPPSAGAKDREALDLLRVKLPGWTLTAENGTGRAVLAPLSDQRKVVPFYMRAAKTWESVTPLCLHGFNASRGEISIAKTDRLLCQAFEAGGFPPAAIVEFNFQTAPYWGGAGAAGRIRVPSHLAKWPRLHVRVRFCEPVKGPVLVVIGRHYGLGIFAAREEQ